jgi:plastocyanin
MKKIKPNHLFLVGALVIAIAILISVAACSSSPATQAPVSSASSATAPAAAPGNTVTINIAAQNMAFDQSALTVKAGAQVTMNFNNKDTMPHNVAIYTDSTAAQLIYKGETFNGPATRTYTFTAPTSPGTYFFRCDVHPAKMTGQFIVQ